MNTTHQRSSLDSMTQLGSGDTFLLLLLMGIAFGVDNLESLQQPVAAIFLIGELGAIGTGGPQIVGRAIVSDAVGVVAGFGQALKPQQPVIFPTGILEGLTEPAVAASAGTDGIERAIGGAAIPSTAAGDTAADIEWEIIPMESAGALAVAHDTILEVRFG